MYALHYKLYTMKIHLNIRVPSYQYNSTDRFSFFFTLAPELYDVSTPIST